MSHINVSEVVLDTAPLSEVDLSNGQESSIFLDVDVGALKTNYDPIQKIIENASTSTYNSPPPVDVVIEDSSYTIDPIIAVTTVGVAMAGAMILNKAISKKLKGGNRLNRR